MANVYAPLYNSLAARGRLSPLGAPGAVRPHEKKKGLGEKAAGALGAMIAEGLASDDKPSRLELIAKARIRDEELRSQLIDQQSKEVPYVATRADLGMKDYSGMQSNLPPSQRTSTPAQYIGDEVITQSFTFVATVEAIDGIMKLGMGHPMGPLKLADLIGIDVCVSIMNVLQKEFNNSKYTVCPLLVDMVRMNKLGVKTKKGFYKY